MVAGVISISEVRDFFDGSFGTLAQTLATQDVTTAGPAFALYHGPPGETLDLEVGFPTDRAVATEGDVRPSELPGGRVARVVHAGSFDGLGDAWGRLATWMQDQGLTPGPDLWEEYLTEPSPDMDPADLRTELNWPIADA